MEENADRLGSEDIDIKIERKGDTEVVLHVIGEINYQSHGELVEAVNGLLNGQFKRVTLDLTQTQYIDSTGMGILVRIKHTLDSAGMELVLANVPELIMDTFGVAKLTRVFQII